MAYYIAWLAFLGQRLYLRHKTKNYSDKLHVDEDKCIGCGKYEKLCLMNNIRIVYKKVVQSVIEKYL